jgi:hypothetical protein
MGSHHASNEVFFKFCPPCISAPSPHVDYDIEDLPITGLPTAHQFPHPAACSITGDCGPDSPGDGDAVTTSSTLAGGGEDDEIPSGSLHAAAVDVLKLRPSAKSIQSRHTA